MQTFRPHNNMEECIQQGGFPFFCLQVCFDFRYLYTQYKRIWNKQTQKKNKTNLGLFMISKNIRIYICVRVGVCMRIFGHGETAELCRALFSLNMLSHCLQLNQKQQKTPKHTHTHINKCV